MCLHGALRSDLFQLKTVANKEYEYIESINKSFFIVDGLRDTVRNSIAFKNMRD